MSKFFNEVAIIKSHRQRSFRAQSHPESPSPPGGAVPSDTGGLKHADNVAFEGRFCKPPELRAKILRKVRRFAKNFQNHHVSPKIIIIQNTIPGQPKSRILRPINPCSRETRSCGRQNSQSFANHHAKSFRI